MKLATFLVKNVITAAISREAHGARKKLFTGSSNNAHLCPGDQNRFGKGYVQTISDSARGLVEMIWPRKVLERPNTSDARGRVETVAGERGRGRGDCRRCSAMCVLDAHRYAGRYGCRVRRVERVALGCHCDMPLHPRTTQALHVSGPSKTMEEWD
jgi:hypothetical protein